MRYVYIIKVVNNELLLYEVYNVYDYTLTPVPVIFATEESAIEFLKKRHDFPYKIHKIDGDTVVDMKTGIGIERYVIAKIELR